MQLHVDVSLLCLIPVPFLFLSSYSKYPAVLSSSVVSALSCSLPIYFLPLSRLLYPSLLPPLKHTLNYHPWLPLHSLSPYLFHSLLSNMLTLPFCLFPFALFVSLCPFACFPLPFCCFPLPFCVSLCPFLFPFAFFFFPLPFCLIPLALFLFPFALLLVSQFPYTTSLLNIDHLTEELRSHNIIELALIFFHFSPIGNIIELGLCCAPRTNACCFIVLGHSVHHDTTRGYAISK